MIHSNRRVVTLDHGHLYQTDSVLVKPYHDGGRPGDHTRNACRASELKPETSAVGSFPPSAARWRWAPEALFLH